MTINNYRFAVIGAGKLAWSVVPALIEIGCNIVITVSRNKKDAKKLSSRFHVPAYSDTIKDISPDTDCFLLTLPDSQVGNTAIQLSRELSSVKGKYFIHFSGVLNSEILKALKSKGALTSSYHIMQSFPSTKRVSVKGCYASVESENKKARKFLVELSEMLEIKSFFIDADKKIDYHLSGVFASNFLAANLFYAEELYNKAVKKIDFQDFIAPIVEATLKNAFKNGTSNAVSGPVERGDLKTIRMHVRHLKKNKELLNNYLVQSLGIINILEKRGQLSGSRISVKKYLLEVIKK